MTQLKILIVIFVIAVSACNSTQNKELVEAEGMALKGYEVQSDSNRTFIQLTEPTGAAQFNFPLPSGNYNIDVSYLSESVGQNTYAMFIADNQIVAWLGKDRDDQWHRLSEQRWHAPHHISINQGDQIRIEALSENGSKVILDYIEFRESTREVSTLNNASEQVPGENMPEIDLSDENMITLYPEEYNKAIKNPLKGFRAYETDHEFGTLIKDYFRWNALEKTADDGVDKIMDVCNKRWEGYAKANVKSIPRVYIDWPGRESGWPEDMTPGDYTSDQFKERVTAMISKMGKAWDNDPRVAYVEMGMIGEWGEMEFPDTRDDIKSAIAAQFDESFQNKLVMIRWPNTYHDHIYNFGYYWDSFAHWDQRYCAYHIENNRKWKTAVIGGEAAYNWGNDDIQPGESPNASLKEADHREYIIDKIRALHTNHLGWISKYDQEDDSVSVGAEIIQKTFGYRFVIPEFSYSKRVNKGSELAISFKVKNTGSSPFYYNWPLEFSLLDPETKSVVWKQNSKNVDISTWLPGDEWDASANSYQIPAKLYTVNQKLKITNLPEGEYILAMAILDPAGNLPCARFAIKNYYMGGRHPLGKIGIDQDPDTFALTKFDDLQSDNSLHYIVK